MLHEFHLSLVLASVINHTVQSRCAVHLKKQIKYYLLGDCLALVTITDTDLSKISFPSEFKDVRAKIF